MLRHSIKLQEGARQVACPPKPIVGSLAQIVVQELEAMIQMEIVEPSTSPWSSPIVIVEEKTFRKSSREGILVLY